MDQVTFDIVYRTNLRQVEAAIARIRSQAAASAITIPVTVANTGNQAASGASQSAAAARAQTAAVSAQAAQATAQARAQAAQQTAAANARAAQATAAARAQAAQTSAQAKAAAATAQAQATQSTAAARAATATAAASAAQNTAQARAQAAQRTAQARAAAAAAQAQATQTTAAARAATATAQAQAAQTTAQARAASATAQARAATAAAQARAAAANSQAQASASRAAAAAARSQRSVATAVQQSNRNVGLHTGSILRNAGSFLQWQLAMAPIVGTLAVIGSGLSNLLKVERQFATLRAVFQGTEADAQRLKGELLDLGTANAQAPDASIDVGTQFARLGLSRIQIIKATEVALQAANVAEIEAGEGARQLIAIYRGFGKTVGDLPAILDTLNAASNRSAATTKDLLDSLSRTGALARQTGLSFQELVGITAAAVEATGRTGAEFGTAIKTILVRLQDADVQGALQEQFSIDAAAGDSADIIGAIASKYSQLASSTDAATQKQAAQLAILVANNRQSSRFISILENYPRGLNLAADASFDFGNAQRENAQIIDTAAGEIDRLKAAFASLSVTIGDAGGEGAIAAVTAALRESISDWDRLIKRLDEVGSFELSDGLKDLWDFLSQSPVAFAESVTGLSLDAPADTSTAVLDALKTRIQETKGALEGFGAAAGVLDFTAGLGEAGSPIDASAVEQSIAALQNLRRAQEEGIALTQSAADAVASGQAFLRGEISQQEFLNTLRAGGADLRAAEVSVQARLEAQSLIALDAEKDRLAVLEKQREELQRQGAGIGDDEYVENAAAIQEVNDSTTDLSRNLGQIPDEPIDISPIGIDQLKLAISALDALQKKRRELIAQSLESVGLASTSDSAIRAEVAEIDRAIAALASKRDAEASEDGRKAIESRVRALTKERTAILATARLAQEQAAIAERAETARRQAENRLSEFAVGTTAAAKANSTSQGAGQLFRDSFAALQTPRAAADAGGPEAMRQLLAGAAQLDALQRAASGAALELDQRRFQVRADIANKELEILATIREETQEQSKRLAFASREQQLRAAALSAFQRQTGRSLGPDDVGSFDDDTRGTVSQFGRSINEGSGTGQFVPDGAARALAELQTEAALVGPAFAAASERANTMAVALGSMEAELAAAAARLAALADPTIGAATTSPGAGTTGSTEDVLASLGEVRDAILGQEQVFNQVANIETFVAQLGDINIPMDEIAQSIRDVFTEMVQERLAPLEEAVTDITRRNSGDNNSLLNATGW